MSEPILIATILRPIGDTGVQTHFRAYAEYLTEHARLVQLITPFDLPKWQVYPIFAVRKLIDLLNGSLSVWWYRYWHAVFLRIALQRALSDGRSCIVYAQCPLSADAALRARLSKQQRVVMVVHFNISQADEWAEKGKITVKDSLFQSIRQFESEILPRLNGLVFVSKFMRDELIKRIPCVQNVPHCVIPNFIEDPGLLNLPKKFLSELICVGTLEPRKNQFYAIEIIAAAKRMGRMITLNLVGDGVDRAKLSELTKRLGVDDLVKFSGYVKNGADLMNHHRAYLHVSHIESFGIVLIEAMARELPVFAPAVGGIPEVFRDNIEGRYIPLDDAHLSACLIIEWIDSEKTLKKAGRAARSRYLSLFEQTMVASNLNRFLDKGIKEII